MRRLRWFLLVLVLIVGLLPGAALAHSAPMQVRWTVTPGKPVAGQPVTMALEVVDSLGGTTPGLDVSVQAKAQGQQTLEQKLTESEPGRYTTALTLPSTGTWAFKVIVHVLDENQVATLKLAAQDQAPADNPPLSTTQWMTIEYTTTHLVLTWGAFAAGLAIIGVLLLTGRKTPPATDTPESAEESERA